MPEYGFSMVRIFPYEDIIYDCFLIRESTGQRKSVPRYSKIFYSVCPESVMMVRENN